MQIFKAALKCVFPAVLITASAAAKVNLAGVAAGTTIAVNAGTFAKWIRHPRREAKKVAKATKDALKGKN